MDLAGDGDYGFPTTLPWGIDYFQRNISAVVRVGETFLKSQAIIRAALYRIIPCAIPRRFMNSLFVLSCFLSSGDCERICSRLENYLCCILCLPDWNNSSIEFLRLNPRLLFGLSEAQLIALILIVVGSFGWWKFSRSIPQQTN